MPDGTYRFVVDGRRRTAGAEVAYEVVSIPFRVTPWTGVTATDPQPEQGGAVSFAASATYPRSYASPFPYVQDDGGTVLCRTCSFRPWASGAPVVAATVTVVGPSGTRTVAATPVGDRWVAATALAPGETASIEPGDLVDEFGETNGTRIHLLTT